MTDTQYEPRRKIYLDLVGPLERIENENKRIVTCQYNLSKYLIATPIQNQTVEEVPETLLNNIILIFGIPLLY